MSTNQRQEEDLVLSEAMLNRTIQELQRLRQENEHYRVVFDRLAITTPGSCKAPSHITRAQAARILGLSNTAVFDRVKAGKIPQEIHWETLMIPMAAIIAELDKQAARA